MTNDHTADPQLHLPVKRGSSGFRWASFRSVPVNRGWQEIAGNRAL